MAAAQPSRYCLFEQRLASRHERHADCGCDGYPVSLEHWREHALTIILHVRALQGDSAVMLRTFAHTSQIIPLIVYYLWAALARKLSLLCIHKEFPRMMNGTLSEIWLFWNKDIKSNQTCSLHFWETSYPFCHVSYYIISWTPTLYHTVVTQMCAVEEYKTVNLLKGCSKMRYWSYFLVVLHANITQNIFSSGNFIKTVT